jgi:hypothetical protein
MNERANEQQIPPELIPPPVPPLADSTEKKDSIDADSADAASVAPSEGSGVSGAVEPPREGTSWMQDA